MRRLCLGLLFLAALAGPAFAALNFPALTGRVVDNAHILSAPTARALEQTLEDLERKTTDQLVVVTLPSLQGDSIEDYGYQLGRAWGIGQKGKDNGVLLVVAPAEHKVRIEVGYGLEGELTDAASSIIINSVILPEFRQGHMENGVMKGANAIASALEGTPPVVLPYARPYHAKSRNYFDLAYNFFLFVIFIFLICRRIHYIRKYGWTKGMAMGGSSGGGGFSSGGFGGGGFSGGGGGFGGGGASGGW